MKYKLVCVEEHCEWANNAEKHCIWPGSYCPKRDGKNPGLRLIRPLRMPDWALAYINASPDTAQRGRIWQWKKMREA